MYGPTHFFLIPPEGITALDFQKAVHNYKTRHRIPLMSDISIEIDIDGDEPCFILSDKRRAKEAL